MDPTRTDLPTAPVICAPGLPCADRTATSSSSALKNYRDGKLEGLEQRLRHAVAQSLDDGSIQAIAAGWPRCRRVRPERRSRRH